MKKTKKYLIWLAQFFLRLFASLGFIILAALIVGIVIVIIGIVAVIFLGFLLVWVIKGNETFLV